MAKSTKKRRAGKPYPSFPLTPHPTNRWCKKIRQRLHYFGPIDDPDGALKEYLRVKDYLHAGLQPPPEDADGLSVQQLVNTFLTDRQQRVDAGALRRRTFRDYHDTSKLIVATLGLHRQVDDLRPGDFNKLRAVFSKGRGPVSVGNLVRMTRVIFKFAYDAYLVEKPVRYGPTFRAPEKRIIRAHQQANGSRMWERGEIHALMGAATVQMRGMILLGINVGLGNADCGTLPQSAIDFQNGWIDYPRPKTAIPRRGHLWPETLAAVRASIRVRPKSKSNSDANLVFLTRCATRWYKDSNCSPLSAEFRKLTTSVGLYRKGVGFYGLRRAFETVAGAAGDQVAVDYVMGHADQSMAAVYRQRIDDDRLTAVADHVHDWLFGEER